MARSYWRQYGEIRGGGVGTSGIIQFTHEMRPTGKATKITCYDAEETKARRAVIEAAHRLCEKARVSSSVWGEVLDVASAACDLERVEKARGR